jgi:hypothetical protein
VESEFEVETVDAETVETVEAGEAIRIGMRLFAAIARRTMASAAKLTAKTYHSPELVSIWCDFK